MVVPRAAIVSLLAMLGASPAQHAPSVVDVIRANGQVDMALLRGDRALKDSVLTPDYVSTDARGNLVSRAQIMAATAKIPGLDTMWSRPLSVRLYGGTAVFVGVLTMKGADATGRPFVQRNGETRVFVLQRGRWRMAAAASAPLPAEDAR